MNGTSLYRRWLTARLGLLAVLWPALTAMAAMAAGDRLPVPAAPQLTRAEGIIRKLFKEEYDRRTAADRQALARKLLAAGHETPNDAAARYVCYREAYGLATLGGDLPTAFTAANAMAREFVVDPRDVQKMKVATYVAIARQVETPEASAAFAEVGLNLLGHMAALENFDDVERLLTPIEAAANRTKQLSLVTRVQASRDEVNALRADAQKASLAAEALKKSPSDPGANLIVGRHLAFIKGYWDTALPLLARSSDPVFKDLSQKELAKPADAGSLLRLADGWWSVAEKQTGTAKANVERHAQEQYQRVLPALVGADASRAASRLPAGMLPQPAVAAPPPVAQAPAPAPPAPASQPAEAAGEVTRYWWTTRMRPPGIRTWKKIDADTWEEGDPQGTVKRFHVVSQDDPQLGSGSVVGSLSDPPLQVWVPKLVEGNLTYFRRSDKDNRWNLMGAIHLGDPPQGG
jgi:hypothetical protein